MKNTVVVRLAFSFNCKSCGHENFVKSVFYEFSPEEQSDMAEELGERPQTGQWLTHPKEVSCQECEAEFRAINPGEVCHE
jgi:transcription elongation factor Elf1